MDNNINNNLNQENNQTIQNNVPVTLPAQPTAAVQPTPTVQPAQPTPTVQPTQPTAAVQPTPTVEPNQPTAAVQPTPTVQPDQPTAAVQQTPTVEPTQPTAAVQQDIIVQAPPEPTVSATQTEHPKDKKNNKKTIIILIIVLIVAIIGLILFLGKDKISNLMSKDKNEQTENTNNDTNNNTNNNSNNNAENNQQPENIIDEAFVDIAKTYANMARVMWTAEAISCNNIVSSAVDDGDYYVMIDTRDGARENLPLLIDRGGKSPWNNRDVQGYVRINVETTPTNEVIKKFYVALTDGTHTISDDNTVTSDELKKGNIMMTTDTALLNKVKMTTDDKDDTGKYTGMADCTWDAINNKYTCSNFTGYGPEAIDKIKAICVES